MKSNTISVYQISTPSLYLHSSRILYRLNVTPLTGCLLPVQTPYTWSLPLPLQLFSETLRTLQDRGLLQSFERTEISLNHHKEQLFLFLRNLLLPFVAGIWVSAWSILTPSHLHTPSPTLSAPTAPHTLSPPTSHTSSSNPLQIFYAQKV